MDFKENFLNSLVKLTNNISFTKSFKDLTSFKCGGEVWVYFFPSRLSELFKVYDLIKYYHIPYIVLGNGTNTLASDTYFEGVVITLNELNYQYFLFDNYLFLFSSFPLAKLSKFKKYNHFLNLSKIPGRISGAIVTNCSFNNSSISDIIDKVLIYDGKLFFLDKKDIEYSYRYSNLKDKDLIIIGCVVNLNSLDLTTTETTPFKLTSIVKGSNAGSVFKNNSNPAYKLIQESLNVSRINRAMISKYHYNIIENHGGNSHDIWCLIRIIQRQVYLKFKVKLELEIHLKNFNF